MNPEEPVTESDTKSNFFLLVLPIVVMSLLLLLLVLLLLTQNHKKITQAAPIGASVPIEESITSTGFFPSTVTVNIGQAVLWTNYDTKSHIVAASPTSNSLVGFNSQAIGSGQIYSFVFNKKGTFNYRDAVYPTTYIGTVIVK